MLNEPSVGDTDSGSSITEQQKMPDLSEQTKLVQRKNNSMSAVVVPVSTSSSGDEGGLHEDMEDKPLDSAGEEVSHPAPILYRTSAIVYIWTSMNGMETEPQIKQTNTQTLHENVAIIEERNILNCWKRGFPCLLG